MMVIIFLFYLLPIHVSGTLYGPRLVISPVGGSVTIKCFYLTTTANRHDRKYWCKESNFPRRSCQTIISTNPFILPEYEGRVSMKDSPHNGILQVTMMQLMQKDSSNYRCGIGKANDGLYAGVNLTVWEGLKLPKSPEICWGKLRGSVMIQCPSETTGLQMRGFCKLGKSGCSPIVETIKGRRKKDERITFSVVDHSGTFNVTIKELRKEDSGIYKCGTGMLNDFGKLVQLQVTEESVFSNIVSETQATYQPKTPSYRHVTSAIVISKERSSQTKQNLVSLVIPILVALLLVLAAIAIAVLIKIRKQRIDASSESPTRKSEGEMAQAAPKCSEEQLKEENGVSMDEEESALSPNKGDRVETIYCLVNKE